MSKRWQAGAGLLFVILALAHTSPAQRSQLEIQQALIGRPLYLRGFWMAGDLEFDGAGHLRKASEIGPLTLSGIDVNGVSLERGDLIIRARRAALVADSDGRLVRRSIYSRTHLDFSLLPSPANEYIAYREVTLLLHPDNSGSFERALKAIFADGLPELATSVPAYWSCYAQGYFLHNMSIVDARKTTASCIEQHSLSIADPDRGNTGDGFTPVKILSGAEQPHVTIVAANLGVRGVSHIRFTVSQHGVPVGFQIMRAVGGGMDEETLRVLSSYKFQPALRRGHPVPADFDINQVYSMAP